MHFAVVGALGPTDHNPHGWWLHFWIATGGSAVGFFFILSGFVLAHTYAADFAPPHEATHQHARNLTAGKSRYRRFWHARVIRIYPSYLLALVLTTGSALWLGSQGSAPWSECTLAACAPAWIVSAVPLQAWIPSTSIQQLWNAPGWSIAAEAFFYLVFPFLVSPIVNFTRRWRWGAIALVWGMQNLAFAALTYAITLPADTAVQEGMRLWLERLPLLRLPEFALGVVAWTLWDSSRHTQPGRFRSPWLFWLLVLTLCALWYLPVASGPAWLKVLSSGKAYSLAPPLFALLIMHLASATHGTGHWGSRVLSCRPVLLLGESSYALYLLHWAVLQSLFAAFRSQGGPPLWAGYGAMVCAIALSVLVHLAFERPIRHYFRRSSHDAR